MQPRLLSRTSMSKSPIPEGVLALPRQVAQVKSGAKEFLRQWKKTKEEAKGVTKELAEETICTLYSNTYRAHQVISEARDNKWGSASEERLTYFKPTRHQFRGMGWRVSGGACWRVAASSGAAVRRRPSRNCTSTTCVDASLEQVRRRPAATSWISQRCGDLQSIGTTAGSIMATSDANQPQPRTTFEASG